MPAPPWPPDDSGSLDFATSRLTAGIELFRVHHEGQAGNELNPGFGAGGRFHFLRADGGTGPEIPSLYTALDIASALAETIFHDVPVRPEAARRLAFRKLEKRVLSSIRTAREFLLVELHHPGLARLGLEPRDLTDTYPTEYPRTRSWAQALHDASDADGLVWMSRLHNTARVQAFFGDRVARDDFDLGSFSVPLDRGLGLEWVYEHAEALGLTIVHP